MAFEHITNVEPDDTMCLVLEHAHRPLKCASEKLGVGTTWLKRFLRRLHPPYLWPYRQIASIDSTLMHDLDHMERCVLEDARRHLVLGGKMAVDSDGHLCMDVVKHIVKKHRRRTDLNNLDQGKLVTTVPKLPDVKEIFGFSE